LIFFKGTEIVSFVYQSRKQAQSGSNFDPQIIDLTEKNEEKMKKK
jgi:hypothetical protein